MSRSPSAKGVLANFRLVLAAPRHPGNVGACARLAANFDLRDWVIVAPQCRWDDFDARKFATGSAERYLERIHVAPDMRAATGDCTAAVGFTRRLGKSRRTTLALSDIAALGAQSRSRIALVFGNEETGLTSDELEPCTHVCQLPTADVHPSFNLSHAVAIALSRVYGDLADRRGSFGPGPKTPSATGARLDELEGMLSHWREFLVDVKLTQAGNPERLLARLREIFERAALKREEIRALRGMLSKAQVRLGMRRRGQRVLP